MAWFLRFWRSPADRACHYGGGVAPAMACGASNLGSKQVVQYQADYIFYRAM